MDKYIYTIYNFDKNIPEEKILNLANLQILCRRKIIWMYAFKCYATNVKKNNNYLKVNVTPACEPYVLICLISTFTITNTI